MLWPFSPKAPKKILPAGRSALFFFNHFEKHLRRFVGAMRVLLPVAHGPQRMMKTRRARASWAFVAARASGSEIAAWHLGIWLKWMMLVLSLA